MDSGWHSSSLLAVSLGLIGAGCASPRAEAPPDGTVGAVDAWVGAVDAGPVPVPPTPDAGVGEPCVPTCGPSSSCVAGSCVCNVGYEARGEGCEDIDECARGACDEQARCVNLEGSFECTCNPGFRGDGERCEDENECASGAHECNPFATCANFEGGYDCNCVEGYEGDGRVCVDIDECEDGERCGDDAECVNTPGAYQCACIPGYSGDGWICEDVDECALGTDDCDPDALCTNTPGGFRCSCDVGWVGDGRSCAPIGVRGHVLFVGHDLATRTDELDRILGNAAALPIDSSLRSIVYVEHADGSAGGPTANAIAALGAGAAEHGRTTSPAILPWATALESNLRNRHVLLIPDQSLATPADLQTIGMAWAPILERFLAGGGIVIVLGVDDRAVSLVAAAGLLDVTGATTLSPMSTLTVTAPADPIAFGLPASFPAPPGAVSFAGSTATAVLSSGPPVVLHRTVEAP